MKHLSNVVDKFEETAVNQENKGIKKYGKPLDPLDDYDWLEMANEEMVDGYKYLVAEKEKRKFIARKIRKLVDANYSGTVRDEVFHWLDELEGKR